MQYLWKVGDKYYTSHDLIREFHPQGENILHRSRNWNLYGNQTIGYDKEVKELAEKLEAERYRQIIVNGQGRQELRKN